MKEKVLLFESRELCYESNRYFVACMAEAFEKKGYEVEICDLSFMMEEKLEKILECQENYLLAIDFNSLLPRLKIEDDIPYLDAFQVPFYNYLVDHPLYHHASLKNSFFRYSILCIDVCHQKYIEQYYPHIKNVFYLPLGAMRAKMERTFEKKRLELLFLGTYEPEDKLFWELKEYPYAKRQEISALIEMMKNDAELTQEGALANYLKEQKETYSLRDFAKRLNEDYLADKYLRNLRRKEAVLAAVRTKVPFTVMGHGWELLEGLEQRHVKLQKGVGFAASIQMMANAKMLLNSTPGFHKGLHDRVYSAMLNHTLCFTEGNLFSRQIFTDGKEVVFYDTDRLDILEEKITFMYEHSDESAEIAEHAFQKANAEYTWENRVETFIRHAAAQ